MVALVLQRATLAFAAPVGTTVSLEPSSRYFYEGDAVRAILVIRNSGQASVRGLARLAEGIEIRGAGGQLSAAGAAVEKGGEILPRHLEPGSTHEVAIDLSGVEALERAGTYELRWSSGDHATDAVWVTILPRYDGSRLYSARLDTALGPIVIQLLPKVSPLAVKVFVDLARAGFYDGSPFHEVRADSYVAAGDPRFGGREVPPLAFPAEQSELSVVPGTVVLKPVGPAPPANGSAFIISLQPQPAWTAQVTVLGQVVEGLDIVQRISRLPLREGGRRPAEEVAIVRVTIAEAAPGAGS